MNYWKTLRLISIFRLYLIFITQTIAQDEECNNDELCNQVILTHSVQIRTHCVYLHILFRNMSETTLPVGVFRLCQNTEILDISNNRLRQIKAGAFLGLNSLRELYLANNRLDRLEPGTFHTLTKLEVFVLTGNTIQTIPEYEFTSKNIRFFNINNNRISRIPQTALLNLKNAQLIDLSLNDIEHLNPITLSYVRNGVKIVLNNNRLRDLPMTFNFTSRYDKYVKLVNKNGHISDFVKPLRSRIKPYRPRNMQVDNKFSILEASGNAMTSLTNATLGEFYKLKLISLDLSFNYIKEIMPETFELYTSLASLYLSHNRLRAIPNDLFKPLTNLYSLDLSYNMLTHLVFEVRLPDAVAWLNYSNNYIESIDEYHWSSKTKRNKMALNLSNNSISYLDANRFCKFMSYVNLAYNKWKCSVLYSIVHTLEMRGVNVPHGYNFEEDNVNGIPCEVGESRLSDDLDRLRDMLNQPDRGVETGGRHRVNESLGVDMMNVSNNNNDGRLNEVGSNGWTTAGGGSQRHSNLFVVKCFVLVNIVQYVSMESNFHYLLYLLC